MSTMNAQRRQQILEKCAGFASGELKRRLGIGAQEAIADRAGAAVLRYPLRAAGAPVRALASGVGRTGTGLARLAGKHPLAAVTTAGAGLGLMGVDNLFTNVSSLVNPVGMAGMIRVPKAGLTQDALALSRAAPVLDNPLADPNRLAWGRRRIPNDPAAVPPPEPA